MSDFVNSRFDKKGIVIKSELTRKQVAGLFAVGESTVDRWCEEGLLERYYIGRRVFFDPDKVAEFRERMIEQSKKSV